MALARSLPSVTVIFPVIQDDTGENGGPKWAAFNDQPIIAGDIENIALSDTVYVGIGPANIRESLPLGFFDDLVPGLQLLLSVGMALPELAEHLLGDDPHVLLQLSFKPG